MQFDPLENKHGVSSLSNPIALVVSSKQRVVEGLKNVNH